MCHSQDVICLDAIAHETKLPMALSYVGHLLGEAYGNIVIKLNI